MRVAMLAPIAWRTPPRHYGPWELFASLLTEGLIERGIEVTLFATGDSQTAAELVAVVPRGYEEDDALDAKVAECLHISEVFERASDFDVIHNGFDFLPLTYSSLVTTPVVTTIHGFSSPQIVAVYRKYNERGNFIAISESDRHPDLRYEATIHHGIDTDAFTADFDRHDALVYFGRIHPHKGTAEAIEVATRSRRPLTIAGIVQDRDYFDTVVAPRVDGERVRYVGSVGPADRNRLLSSASALIHLVNFDEPFGFSVVEAMACGTPVIASRRGSMPELVDDGETGFLVDDIDEAVAAVDRLEAIDRRRVRAEAVRRFDRRRMVDDYLAVYRRVIERAR